MAFDEQDVGSAVRPCPLATEPVSEHWIEIELVGEDDQPIPWEEYVVILPDGKEVTGYLDNEGFARLARLPQAGVCRVGFPNLDKDAWEKIGTFPEKPPKV